MEKRLSRLEDEVTTLKMKSIADSEHIRENAEDIKEIKENTTWILRLILGGFISTILAYVIESILK